MMSSLFWRSVAERAIKTFAQALLSVLAVSSAPIDVLHVSLVPALSVAAGATLLSVLTSLSSLGVGTPGTASAAALPPVIEQQPVTPAEPVPAA